MRLFIALSAIAILMTGGGPAAADDPPVLAPRAILKDHVQAVWCVAFSADGKLLASGGGNLVPGGNNTGELFLWNPVTGKRMATLPSQGGRVRALDFSPDGKILAAGYEPENLLNGGITVLWNLPAKTPKGKTPFAACALAFSDDGKLLALGGVEPAPPQGGRTSGGLKIWDITQSREISNLIGHRGPVESVAFSPNGRMIASGGLEGSGILWDVGSGKLTTTLSEKLGNHPAIAISPDGETLALGSFNKEKASTVADEVTLIDLKTMKTRTKTDAGNNINALAFSHDGKTLAVGTGWATEGEVILLNPAD